MATPPLLKGFTSVAQAFKCVERTIDIIGVVVDLRLPMPTKGADWTVTFDLCDRSSPSHGICVRVFKTTMELLPQIHSIGDVILLRGVKVKYFGTKLVLLSSFNISWIISHVPAHPKATPVTSSNTSTMKPKPQELEYIKHLHNWWSANPNAPISRAAPPSSIYQKGEAGYDRQRRFGLIKDMRFDCFYDIVGFVVKVFPGVGNFTVYITDYTENPMLHTHGRSDHGDGDHDYGSRMGSDGHQQWEWPQGQYTLQVTLWDVHADAARRTLREGAYVRLQNVRAKKNGDGMLEGALHGDRAFPDKICFHVIEDMENVQVRQVIQRKEEYNRGFENDNLRYEKERQVRIAENKKKEAEKQAQKDEGNKHVRCQGQNYSVTPISQILDPIDTTAPFVNRKYRIYCRVIDYLPKTLEDFSVSNDAPATQDSDEEKTAEPWAWRFALLVEGKDGASMRVIVEGDDAVHLLNMDAVDLRRNSRALKSLREKLFVLWGSLEERTQQRLRQKAPTTSTQNQSRKRTNQARKNKPSGSGKRRRFEKQGKRADTDLDYSDADESTESDAEDGDDEEEQYGKMFEACVKEYGVPDGTGWKRLHKLFGTVIS